MRRSNAPGGRPEVPLDGVLLAWSAPMAGVFLELRRDGEQYVGRCWQEEDRQGPARLSGLRLGPADTVAIPDPDPPHTPRPYTLQQLVDALIRFHPKDLQAVFEERGQVTLGKYLWDETLGKLDRYAAASDVDLRILTDDEHLAGLPWPLLMRGEVFVTTDDWTISLVTRPGGLKPAELPPSPRLLMVAPEPTGVGATKWSEHFSELKRLLEEGGPQLAAEDHFRCVHTWDAVSGRGPRGGLGRRLLLRPRPGRPQPKPPGVRDGRRRAVGAGHGRRGRRAPHGPPAAVHRVRELLPGGRRRTGRRRAAVECAGPLCADQPHGGQRQGGPRPGVRVLAAGAAAGHRAASRGGPQLPAVGRHRPGSDQTLLVHAGAVRPLQRLGVASAAEAGPPRVRPALETEAGPGGSVRPRLAAGAGDAAGAEAAHAGLRLVRPGGPGDAGVPRAAGSRLAAPRRRGGRGRAIVLAGRNTPTTSAP